MEDEIPTYIRTDLAAMLQDAQFSTLNFIKQNKDIISDNIHITSSSEKLSILHTLQNAYHQLIKIQAPMVRCSRPSFRKLCRLWGTDVSYTHMIISDSFIHSEAARLADFSMYYNENKLIAQIAACSGPAAAQAAIMLAPYCDAVDINCGCPQRWVMQEGFGADLLNKPEVVGDMVRCIYNALPSIHINNNNNSSNSNNSMNMRVTVKMRVEDNLNKSVDFARQCAAAGVSWLTVHGRTPKCSQHAPVNINAIQLIRETIDIPTVANGGVWDVNSALRLAINTGVGGVMSGTGLLANPACFYLPHNNNNNNNNSGGGDDNLHFMPQHHYDYDSDYNMEMPIFNNLNNMQDDLNDLNSIRLKGLPYCPLEVISDFIRLSSLTDLSSKATSMHLLKMGSNYLSPTERVFIAQMHSSFSITAIFQNLGLYIEEGKFPREACM